MSALEGIRYGAVIEAASERHGVDPRLLAAVAAQETGGPGSNSGRNIVGDGGHGHGVFQIDDRWHPFARTVAAMDPKQNADYAAGMISGLIHRYGGDVHAALSAYNSGSPTAVGTKTTWGDGTTLGYADSVMRHYSDIASQAAPAAAPVSAPEAVDNDSLLEQAIAEQSTLTDQMTQLSQFASIGSSSIPAAVATPMRIGPTQNGAATPTAMMSKGDALSVGLAGVDDDSDDSSQSSPTLNLEGAKTWA